ncbi:queuosine precursor transporter [Spirochaeta dissipatitropha]
MILILLWIVASLAVTTLALAAGRRYGASFLVAVYAALIVMANIFAGKIVMFGPWTVPAGVIVYGVSFLLTDALNEFFGFRAAKEAILGGFSASLLLVVGVQIVIAWEPAVFWGHQQALETILGSTWRIAAASLLAFLVSQNWDIYVFQWLKTRTSSRALWLRNIGSTTSSQTIDTLLFCLIAFAGTMPWPAVWGIILGQLIVKLIIALIDTPFLYIMKAFYTREPADA